MIRRVLWVGVLAGLAAGLAIAALQLVTTTPLILAAEVHEASGGAKAAGYLTASDVVVAHGPAASGHDAGHGHDHGSAAWSPADGLERTLTTSLATVLTATGYALVLIAVMLIAGERITLRAALGWGAAGFAATGLAVGLGLAPELPGAAAGDLVARQVWWVGTAAATAAGLYGLLKRESLGAKAGGLVLIALPHLVGAPRPARFESAVPAELAAHFASTSLAVHAAMWILVAALIGILWERSGRTA